MAASPSQPELIDMEVLERAAECLRTLAHPVRLRMVQLLLRGDYNVGELAEACKIPSHMASEHLRLMQHCGLLTRRQEGRQTFYQIGDPHLVDIMHCIETRFADTPPTDAAE